MDESIAIIVANKMLVLLFSFFIVILARFFFHFYRQPLNANFAQVYVRKNESGWWLGRANDWQLVELSGEIMVTNLLILLTLKIPAYRLPVTVWLWRDSVGPEAHRALRVLLGQNRY